MHFRDNPLLRRWSSAGLVARAAVIGAATVAFVAAVFLAAVLAVGALGAASASEGRSSNVIDRATQMGEDFLDLHDGVRGFALTDRPSFLAPFWRGVSRLPHDLDTVRALTRDNPSQLALLDKIATNSQAYIVDYAMPFIAHPRLAVRDRAAFTIVGQRRMDVLRAQFNQLVETERALAAQRRANTNSKTNQAVLIALIGLVGSSLVLIALVWTALRSVARPVRRLSDAVQRLRAGEAVTVPEEGAGEIKALATSFNAMATELKRREQQLEGLSRIDPLTGVANRRAFEDELPRALATAQRTNVPMSLLMIDLDRFKAYNDGRGHIAGDSFLKEVTARWQQELRLSDMLARFGGEEFAVVLPNCTLDGAFVLAERLRRVVPDEQSCSIGVATCAANDSSSDFTARADAALMTAKRHGRDRTHAVTAA
jgi:diguanylate cyclase (GGDEF)-like protein